MSKRTQLILERAKNIYEQTDHLFDLPMVTEDGVFLGNNECSTNFEGSSSNLYPVVIAADQEFCHNEFSGHNSDFITLYPEVPAETKTYHTLVTSCEIENITVEMLPATQTIPEGPEVGSDLDNMMNSILPENDDVDHQEIDLPTGSLSVSSKLEEKVVEEDNITKAGTIRRRKKVKDSLAIRKKNKAKIAKGQHTVRPACDGSKCKLKCASIFADDRRQEINEQFWNLSHAERRAFVLHSCERLEIKRRTNTDGILSGHHSRNNVFKYNLNDTLGKNIHVCKHFYLSTLGYKPTNDRFVFEVLSKTPKGSITPLADKRGKSRPANFIPKTEIDEHIESYNPVISHYRREHAPNIRYLPSDVTVKSMHADFLEKFPTIKVSYNVYRCQVKKKHISFAKLGNEECEHCECMRLHGHKEDSLSLDTCEICRSWKVHIDLAKESRDLYRRQANEIIQNDSYFSADLEKIIMLPRLDTFKKVVFTKRLTVYNESFVPLGKKSKVKPFAALWHEGISGRDQEDIVSTFYAFFKKQRDSASITLWLDNCSSQNKNWCFLSFLVYIINSNDISADKITINYFEPGHTYMSADSFHHQVELSLKRLGKTYDFPDFVSAVAQANTGVVDVKTMRADDFYKWKSYASQHKLKQQTNRVYLKNIVQLTAIRGEYHLLFKISYCDFEPPNCLNFLQVKAMQPNGMKLPESLTRPRGFPSEKKENILKNLSEVMPENRKEFWVNIPVRDD